MKRPTLNDVAKAADVGVATVDRVLNKRAPVSRETAERVYIAAETLGYHAASLIRQRLDETAEPRTLGFLIQRRTEPFYSGLGSELVAATRANPLMSGRAIVEYLDDISPQTVADRLLALSRRTDAIALVAADHALISESVAQISQSGKPVISLLSDLTAAQRAGFVGIDHRKAGRTAAWSISRLAKAPGKVGIFVGSHRYLGQESAEMSFRSYFRENAPDFSVLEPISTFEKTQFAYEGMQDLLRRHPDLVGVYVAGGGMEGVIEALRESHSGKSIIAVCNELIPETRSALIDGIIDVVIATPVAKLAEKAVEALAHAMSRKSDGQIRFVLPFDLYVSENI
jgi:LacI family transcriptional regulator